MKNKLFEKLQLDQKIREVVSEQMKIKDKFTSERTIRAVEDDIMIPHYIDSMKKRLKLIKQALEIYRKSFL